MYSQPTVPRTPLLISSHATDNHSVTTREGDRGSATFYVCPDNRHTNFLHTHPIQQVLG